jgi:predicted DNA-binding transcriptional regulator AlpA
MLISKAGQQAPNVRAVPLLIGIDRIRRKLGVASRQRADQISRQHGFPRPVQVEAGRRLWDEAEVDAWLDENRPGWRERLESSGGE